MGVMVDYKYECIDCGAPLPRKKPRCSKCSHENTNQRNSVRKANLVTARTASIDTVNSLIRVHQDTIAQIAAGQKFTRESKDVTREIRVRCKREIAQCQKVLDALRRMGAGDFARASEMLREIQEYLPSEH